MRRSRSTLLALICLLVFAQAAVAKDTWTSVRSKNFFLVGNASEKEIKQVATRMEQFREVFRQLLPRMKFDSSVPTTVVVFKNDDAYKPFKPVVDGKPSNVAGYFQAGEAVNYITLTPPRSGTSDPYRVIYHEYVHLLVANTMGAGAMPPWFNEGLAEYYSTFAVDDNRKVRLGELIPNHILLLRRSSLAPLKTLFELDNYSLHRNRTEARQIFYAQAWALVHYLIHGNNGARASQMEKFLTLTSAGGNVEDAFTEAFQTSLPAMEKELKAYVNGNNFRAHLATFNNKLEFDADMRVVPLTEPEADAYLGDLLRATNRPDEAAERLRKALDADPKLAMAHASMGMTRTLQRRFAEAQRHLREAVAADSKNYLAHYYYAYALSREGMSETSRVNGYAPETLREMRAALERAATLNPDFPETYHLLAFINLVAGEYIDESINLIGLARALAPGKEEYAFVLAQLYMKKEEFDAALRSVEPLARSASDPQIRANAQALADSISNYREQLTRYKSAQAVAGRVTDDEEVRGEDGTSSAGASPRLMPRGRLDDPADAPPPAKGKSEDELADEVFMSTIREALRKPAAGETRLLGLLKGIECDAKGFAFIVRVGERTLRLGGSDFNKIKLTSYIPDAGNSLGCGPLKTEIAVVVTYQAAASPRAKTDKTDGSAVALEFVPARFRLEQ